MAIGPEQLDIDKLAKLFLLKSQLGHTLTKEDLRNVLLLFEESDFDGIRENIYPQSAEKKALRAMIQEATEFLKSMSIGLRDGQYTQESYNVLAQAISIAEGVARTTYDGDGLEGVNGRRIMADTTAALMNAKERTYASILCEDGREVTIDNELYWYSPHNYYGNGEWRPVKHLRDENSLDYYVTLENSLPDSFVNNTNIIRGLFLHDEAANKDVIITRQSMVNGRAIRGGSGFILGGDFDGVLLIDGAILNDILYCANEDVRYAAIASSYLERPINPAPCTFFADNAGIRYENNFAQMFMNVSNERGELTDEAKVIFNIIDSNLAAGQKEIESTTTITSSRGVLTAIPNMADGRHIYVDNQAKVITGVGTLNSVEAVNTLKPGSADSILFCSNGANVQLHPVYEDTGSVCKSLQISIVSADGKTVQDTYDVAFEEVLVDQQADLVEGKRYISKYHPVDKSLSWVPAVMLGNKYYISPEPIDSELRLYKDNDNVIQIVGILDKGFLYSRDNIPKKYPELISQVGQYRLKHVDAGYYDGFIFSGNQVNAETLRDYLQYLDVFKADPITNLPGGNNGILGWVKSEFIEITVNGVATGDYYWQGQAKDIVRLPDTRDECITYLNVIAFKSLPDEVQQ